jgi:hemolysin III
VGAQWAVKPVEMPAEEIANSLTHGLGLALSVVGLVVLIAVATLHGTDMSIVTVSVYGATL